MTTKSIHQNLQAKELEGLLAYYPAELIEAALIPLMAKDTDYCIDEPMNITHVFYAELNEILQRNLFNYQQKIRQPIADTVCIDNSYLDLIAILKALIPIEFIFCKEPSHTNASFIIVLKKDVYKPLAEIKNALSFALVAYPKVNCTAYAYCTMNDLIKRGHFYFSKLCSTPNCIYQAKANNEIPQAKPNVLSEINAQAATFFSQFEQKASSFLENATYLITQKQHALGLFMLQQTCEFSYRGLITSFSGKSIKTHDLLVLRKKASLYDPNILGKFYHKVKKEGYLLKILNEAYTKSRYDTNYNPEAFEIQKLVDLTSNLLREARNIFNTYLT
ncbi:MAG: HEPN domain-containing protein [Flavobacterium sp.]|nr:MAG: HEPN domain-containing protein [Flavobacterium sp.]